MSLMTDYNPHFVKKVYCINCKFNKSGFGIEYDWCKPYFLIKPKKKTVITDDYYEKYHFIKSLEPEPEFHYMCKLNKKNDCKYYKCKWWKVWVR